MATESRRAFLGRLALGLGVVATQRAFGQPAERAAFVGAETSAETRLSQAVFVSASGERLGHVPLDFRAHGFASHGTRLVVFPRRPGDRFALLDRRSLEILKVVAAPPDRSFYGHGAFTRDGAHLLIAENDLETLGGAIGIYDSNGARVGHVALPGPGPHEIARHPSRDVFFVAVGGLETHPDYGRTPFNLHQFHSEIVVFDFERGTLDSMGIWPGTEGVSLRHLAMDHAGRLYVGGQVTDESRARGAEVLWVVDRDRVDRIETVAALGGYVSSVAASGNRALVSSKETGMALKLDGTSILRSTACIGASAVGLGPRVEAVAGFTDLNLGETRLPAAAGFEFDNHGLAVLAGGTRAS